ncbi:neurotactin isoform X2 [Frankliniella occidentalis]|uniref:Neurotactin isoform X2 n=1 Tax=Frankliniella occidentalis TaxID=133901 RepID=A0A9C6U6H4_FRAOC|nr:neurotactin isoform X2 [Frankliniella occidentalis]
MSGVEVEKQEKTEKEEKTEDKKEIEEEEREKMLNEENKKQTEEAKEKEDKEKEADDKNEAEGNKVSTGEVERKRKALEEATKKDAKGHIPIGGIRMPGFLQRRSKAEKGKEPDPEEGVDLLEEPGAGAGASKGEGDGEAAREGFGPRCQRSLRRMLPAMSSLPKVTLPRGVPAVRPHLASLKLANPFAKKKKERDVEAGPTVTSEENAAPDETTPVQEAEPGAGANEKEIAKAKEAGVEIVPDTLKNGKDVDVDGMETVQLDAEEKGDPEKGAAGGADASKDIPLLERIRGYKHKTVAGGVIAFVLALIIIVSIAVSGPHHDFAKGPIADGKFATATVSCGLVQGILESGAYTFRGIPYARPPVGKLRWQPAQPMNNLEHCWNGTFPAHNSSNYCWQIFPEDQSMNGAEDCLTLDVFTPQVSFENPLPVVVVVGSSHMTGGSTTPLLQPTAKLSRAKEVVFVRPNFRLGVLGFLTTNALTKSTYPPTSGNYGLSDIKLALEWVKQNIEAFGGDPKSVTVLGYRAGATLVTALTSSPAAKGLMKRVWVTSGSADFPGRPLSESQTDSSPFLARLQRFCTEDRNSSISGITADCLRSIEVEDLLDAMPNEWRPSMPDLPAPVGTAGMPSTHQWLALDGDILRTHPSEVWEKWENEGSPLQIVIGATAHSDATVELYRNLSDASSNNANVNEQNIINHIEHSVLGELNLTKEAINRYNATWPGLAAIVSDIRTVCPLNVLATKMPSAYFYVTTFPISVSKSDDELQYQEPLAELGIDVAAIMGRVEGATPEERRYITAMQQLFYQFVRFGELHHSSDSYTGRILVVDQDTLPKVEYPNCNFWIQKDVVPRFGHRN